MAASDNSEPGLDSPEPLTEDDLVRAVDLVVAASSRQWAVTAAGAQLAATSPVHADVPPDSLRLDDGPCVAKNRA